MPAVATTDEFVDLIRKSQLLESEKLDAIVAGWDGSPPAPRAFADSLVRRGLLTPFQAGLLLAGKWRGFQIGGGKYRLLQLLGVGGMGKVYLCEHVRMKRLVALKFLPAEHIREQSALERFNREAVAAAALNHPNIVRAFDIDQDGDLHFLVMEYVDGASLQDIVSRHGPLDVTRASHYVSQAALGLQHAHEAGWVHRDIKPGNLLLDRTGTVKILDMGLARFFRSTQGDGLTEKYDSNSVLGTADYLAPEQAINSTDVDIRADIYALGATLYFLLTGRAPFEQGTVAEKLLAHQMRDPVLVTQLRPEVPKSLDAVIRKMMAKKPVLRYQVPLAVVEALQPWTQVPIEPPADEEMPRLCSALECFASAGGPTSGLHHHSTSRMTRPTALSSGDVLRNGNSKQSAVTRRPENRPIKVVAGVALGLTCVAAMLGAWNLFPTSASPTVVVREPVPAVPPTIVTTARTTDVSKRTVDLPESAATGWIFVCHQPTADLADKGLVVATLAEAVRRAEPGRRIVVLDDVVEGSIGLTDPDKHSGVVLESGLPPGRHVRWTPGNAVGDAPLLVVANVANVRVRGFDVNGQGRVNVLLQIRGACPGLLVSDVELSEFQSAGMEVAGTPAQLSAPVIIERGHFLTVPGFDKSGRDRTHYARPAALTIAATPAVNGGRPAVICRECRFEGVYKSVVRLEGPVHAEFERNRFYTLKFDRASGHDGVDVFATRGPARVSIRSNTAVSFTNFMRLEDVPALESGAKFELKNNLMAGGLAWVMPPGGIDDSAAAPLFAGSEGNVCRLNTCKGGLSAIKRTQMAFSYLYPAPDERQFLRYPKSDPLASAGENGAPVGYPPD